MDAAKPSSEGQPKTTANDSGTAAPKPAEGTAAAAKRPEQMFVVQKSGPVPAGAAPGQSTQAQPAPSPDAAPKNAFQSAITQGAPPQGRAHSLVSSLPARHRPPVQPGTPANQPGAPAAGQPAGVPAGAKPAGIQPPRPQAGASVPATVAEAGLPELAEVEIRPDPLLSCLVILTRLFGNPKSLAALASGLPIGEAGMTPDLFVRAAENAGLSASKVRRGLAETKSINLPAVLLLKDRQAVVMLSPIKNGKVDIATTDNLDGIVTAPARRWRRSIPAPCWWCGRRSGWTAAPRR